MRHFDHALSEGERELLDQHIGFCPRCRALMGDLQGIMQTLETAPPMEPPSDLEKLVMNRIQSLPVSQSNGSNNLIKALYGSMSMAAVMLTCAVSLGLHEAGILDLFLLSAHGLNSFLEKAWNFQIVYNLLSGVFSQMIFSILNTIQAVYIIAGFTAIVVGFKKLVMPGPAFQKVKD
jgi:hypothetical protein